MSEEYGNTRDRPDGCLPSVAGIEKRNNKTMAPTWRVLWRENGQRQYELFTDEHNATQFRRLVEAGGNQWPYGLCVEEQVARVHALGPTPACACRRTFGRVGS